MTKPTQVPGIPPASSALDPQTKKHLDSVAEAVEIRLGVRGDPLDRAVTVRELIESGLAGQLKAVSFDPNNINPSNFGFGPPAVLDYSVPPTAANVSVSGAYSQVNISWDYPVYKNHSFTEIYGHSTNDIGSALLVGVSTGRVYIDPIGGGQSRYYWIRHVSTSSIRGAWNSATGTLGQTATDTAHQLNVLSGAITSSELATSLATPINDIPGIKTDVQDLEGQYSVKIDNNGHVSGFGLSSTSTTAGPTSAFIVRADKFAVIDPADTGDGLGTTTPSAGNVPFFIQSGNTFIKSAMIEDASITNAKIGSLSADKISTGTLNAARIGTNSIAASKLKIDNNILTENASGELILQTGSSSTTGVKFENLSFDAVGLIASAATSGTASVGNQTTVTYAQFTTGMPYSVYFLTSLPLVLSLDVPASSIRESGTYFLDFGGTPVGSTPNSPSYSIESALVLDVYRKNPSDTLYSIYSSRGSVLRSGQSNLALTTLNSFTTIYLDQSKDHRFKMHGFFKNMSTSSSGAQGFSSGYIRLLRLHKTT